MAHTNMTGNRLLPSTSPTILLGAKKYNWPDRKLLTFFFVNHFLKKKGTWTQNMIKTAFP